jgi:hypothetical protein
MTAKVGGSGSVSGERGRGRSVISQSSAQGSGRSATLSPAQGSGKSGTARKTTSALFREIDELVGKDDGGKAGGD